MHYYLLIVDESEGTSTQEGPFDSTHERDEMAEEFFEDGHTVVWLNVSATGLLKSGTYGELDDGEDDEDDEDEDEDFDSLNEEVEVEDDKWS